MITGEIQLPDLLDIPLGNQSDIPNPDVPADDNQDMDDQSTENEGPRSNTVIWRCRFKAFMHRISTCIENLWEPYCMIVWWILFAFTGALILGIVVYFLTQINRTNHRGVKNIELKAAAEPSGAISMSCVLAGLRCNADHAAIMPRPVQSQLHQDVVRVLRTAQYTAFADVLDNLTESAVHQGITVFAPSNGALFDFKKNKTHELRPEEVVRFHVITDVMPFSKLLRLEVGSILKTDVSNMTIVVTNATAASFKVDDAEIVDPDMYTEAAIAVHGINAVFNTSKIYEEELNQTVIAGRTPLGVLPFPFHSRAFKTPVKVNGVLVYQILMFVAGLLLTYHLAPDV